MLRVLALLAWIPLCWQPLRGQSPAVRKDVAQNPKQKATPATSQPQIGTSTSPLVVETHTRTKNEEEAAEAKADKDHAARVERWTLFFTGAAALFTGLLVWIGRRGIVAANRTLEAIKRQADSMDRQLIQMESQTRPWIGLDVNNGMQTTPLTINENGDCSAVITITCRNFGNYPGQNVFAAAQLVITRDMNDVHAEERKICTEGVPTNFGSVLFPGLSRLKWEWPSVVRRAEIVLAAPNDTEMLAFLVGCIWYKDQFAKAHYTVFSYQLKQPGTIRGKAFNISIASTVSGSWVESHGFVDPPETQQETRQDQKAQ